MVVKIIFFIFAHQTNVQEFTPLLKGKQKMKIKFVAIGKTVEKYIVDACAEYEKRIKKYISFEYIILKDLKNTANMPFDTIKQKEAELLQPYLDSSSVKILLDEHGKEFTSVGFADYVNKKISLQNRDITFIIGGPYGFDSEVYAKADEKISLSKMTFSHQMVRLIFLEQLYRAFTIINHEPYHHE